jgi:hypothetical protein
MLPADFAGQRVQCPKCGVEFAALATSIPAMEVDGPAPPVPKPAAPSEPALQTAYAPSPTAPPAAPAPASMIYCVECGTRFGRDEEACPACGFALADLGEPAPRGNRRRPRPLRLQPVWGAMPIFGALLLPLALALFVSGPIIYESVPRRQRWIGEVTTLIGCIAGAVAVLAALVCICIWLYQAWRLVSRDEGEFSPGLMVGLLFVPFFNFYWIFRAIPGLSTAVTDELRYLSPHRRHGAGWPAGLVACILVLIPYFQPIALCLFLAWMLIANNAVQRLIRHTARIENAVHGSAADTSDE